MNTATSLKPEIKKIVDTALQHILSAGKPDKVFLFGSYARGEENEDSDMDFYIVEDLSIRKGSNAAKLDYCIKTRLQIYMSELA